jgi:hypothetical protein
MKMKTATQTLFRTFEDSGETIALFPAIPFDLQGCFCMSYMHVGQHGAAKPSLPENSRQSTPEEIAILSEELTKLGYEVHPVSRISLSMHLARKLAAQEFLAI